VPECLCRPFVQHPECVTHPSRLSVLTFPSGVPAEVVDYWRGRRDAELAELSPLGRSVAVEFAAALERRVLGIAEPIVDRDPGDETDWPE
jgi:hypothetical protein